MTLTKQEAIENHRKMWNWIADELETRRSSFAVDILSIKQDYFRYNKISPNNIPHAYCYCCEYAKATDLDCTGGCPIDWGTSKNHYGINGCMCKGSVYMQFVNYYIGVMNHPCIKASNLARQIANLPEREDV